MLTLTGGGRRRLQQLLAHLLLGGQLAEVLRQQGLRRLPEVARLRRQGRRHLQGSYMIDPMLHWIHVIGSQIIGLK